MAAGSVSVLSPILVVSFQWSLDAISWFSRWNCSLALSHRIFLSFFLFPCIIPSCPSSVALLYMLNMCQLTVSVSTGRACIPAFNLGSRAAGMHGGRGCPPVIHLNFSSVFEMASQRPCMINVTTLTCTVLPRVPTEYLKTRNIWKPTGLRSEDVWLAISLLFKLSNCRCNAMHSGEQTHQLSEWCCVQTGWLMDINTAVSACDCEIRKKMTMWLYEIHCVFWK